MLRYIISTLSLLLVFSISYAQTDTTVSNAPKNIGKRVDKTYVNGPDSAVQVIDTIVRDTMIADTTAIDTNVIKRVVTKDTLHQVRLGIDILRPILNRIYSTRMSYEFEADYYYRKEIYFVAEGGWGSASTLNDTNYLDLQYESSNTFFKLGVNKSMLSRLGPRDWDMAFIGARYGIALIQRSAASYSFDNPFWGGVNGSLPAKSITGHWLEVTAGARLELYKGIFAGWNVRTKFRLNRKPFQDLPPLYIAGYGQGNKNAIFDFNFYISYAIRWK